MKSNELLHELIHSLTKSEKRYFSVFTSTHKEGNNYKALFDAIQSQKEYSEKELLEKFKKEDFVRQFSVAKNYLINLILRSLSGYHQKSKKTIELNNSLSEIEILYWKGLYKLALKKVNQAKKIAQKYDMSSYILLINYWERKIEEFVSDKMVNEKAMEETELYLNSYNQQMKMNLLVKELENTTQLSIKRTDLNLESLKKLLSHDLLKLDESKLHNFHTHVDYLHIKGVGYGILGDKDKEFESKMKLLELMEENPHHTKENPLQYAQTLYSILVYYLKQGYPKEYLEYLAKMDEVDLKFHHAIVSYQGRKFILELGYYLHTRDNKKVREIAVEIEDWYTSASGIKSMRVKMIIEFNLALSYFLLNNTKKSLQWCNNSILLFDMKAQKFRHDLAISSLMIQLFIYVDLGHNDLAMKNIETILSIANKNKYGEVEILIFKAIKEMLKIGNLSEGIKIIKKLIENDEAAFINLDVDVIIFWLEKKGL
ncbi:MAG: hypothetical protein HRT73_01390 [Flavobacteriales bacterium]|nr:hypothetical protein [Flavobacteriales bacterium]